MRLSSHWRCIAFSLPRSNTAVVDFGYGERKSSADEQLIVQDISDAKLNIKFFQNVKKRLDETADVDIAKWRIEQLPLVCNH